MALLKLPKNFLGLTDWRRLKCNLDHPLCPTHGFFVFPAPGVMVNLRDGQVTNSFGNPGFGHRYPYGPFPDFTNPASTTLNDYFETEITDSFSELTIASSVRVPGIYNSSRYYELITRGSTFANDTNFAFGLRKGSSASTKSIFTYSRSSGGTLSGVEFDVALLSGVNFTVGSVFRSSGNIDTYFNGDNVDTDTSNTLYGGGTQKVRVGAGTSPTSSASGFQDEIHWVYLSETPLSDAQMRQIMDDPFVFLEPVTPQVYFPVLTPSGNTTLSADVGTYTLGSDAVNLLTGRKLNAEVATYNLGSDPVTFIYGPNIQADVGTYTLGSDPVNLLVGRHLDAAVGTYTLGSDAVNFSVDRRLTADVGTYTLGSDPVNLTYTPVDTLSADVGVYTLGSDAVNLLYNRRFVADPATYSLAITDVTLTVDTVQSPDCFTWLVSDIQEALYLVSAISETAEYVVSEIDESAIYLVSNIDSGALFLTGELCSCP